MPMTDDSELESLRREIDSLDDSILDLIERRAALSEKIAAAKAAAPGRLPIRPGREAAVLERLKRRARGTGPDVIEAIWRELMGQSRQAQGPLTLVLCTSQDRPLFEARVRAHFGSSSPIEWVDDPAAAVERACGEDSVAILEADPPALADGLAAFDVIRGPAGEMVAVAVGRVAPEGAPEAEGGA